MILRTILTVIFSCIFHLLFTSPYSKDKDLILNIKLLPEFKDEFAGKQLKLYVDINDKRVDTILTVTDEYALRFLNPGTSEISIRIDGIVTLRDSTQRHFWTGRRFKNSKAGDFIYQIGFPFNCELNRYYGGKYCPTCKKSDKAILIKPGEFDVPGEVGVDYIPRSHIRTSCEGDWYCKRDSIEY